MAMAKTEPPLTDKVKELGDKLKERGPIYLNKAKTDTVALIKNPKFQTLCVSTSAGAIVLGSAGGAFGCASGIVVGGTAGVVPAIITFGLSIPAGAALGGGIGLCTGAVVGGSAGALGGGAAGHTCYKHRVQIKDGLLYIQTKAVKTKEETQIKITGVVEGTMIKVKTTKANAMKMVASTQEKVTKLLEKTIAFAREPKVQVTTAGAATGTVAGGAVGGSAGVIVGAAVGVVPALFTFGLSIPVGAVVGGGIGLFTGGSVGAVGGGAAGFAGYKYRKQLGESKDSMVMKVKDLKDRMSGTGGTA